MTEIVSAKNTDKCFLDMDGVIAWCTKPIAEEFGRTYDEVYPKGVRAPWDLPGLFGIEAKAFWDQLNRIEFWRDLPKTKEADEIVRLLEARYGNKIYILSSAGLSFNSMPGKMLWLQKHYPQFVWRAWIGNGKEGCASEGALLVDDNDDNVRKFNEQGGYSYLVPRPWNTRFRREEFIIEELKEVLNR